MQQQDLATDAPATWEPCRTFVSPFAHMLSHHARGKVVITV
jgi:hypothetical protein